MAVTSEYRKTGVIARVVDTNLNAWEDFTGTDINLAATYQAGDTSTGETDQAYWAYRGQADICKLANGNIVRVRNGDWTDTTLRDIQVQVITDPTNPAQWLAWTNKGWGTNYAVAIEADAAAAAGYRIYHAKSDGVYMDNVLVGAAGLWSALTIVKIKTVFGQTNMIYVQSLSTNIDTSREVTWYYVKDTTVGSPTVNLDCAQWHHYHHDMAIAFDGATGYRFRATPLNDAERNLYASDTLTVESALVADRSDPLGVYNTYDNVYYLKGPSARAGFKRIDELTVAQLTDPEYGTSTWYVFYTERHMDQFGNVLSNLKSPVFWSRAPQGLMFPSQSTPIGFSIWGFAGVAESNGYVYLCGNGRVLRRLIGAVTYDIGNYVLSGSYSLPRDNAAAQLQLVCANPQNVVGNMLGLTSDNSSGLTDRKLDFGIGTKLAGDPFYLFKRDARWVVSALSKTRDTSGSGGTRDHVTVEGGDFWYRMSTPFRDTWSIPGRFDRTDWQPDAVNDISQYTNAHDEIVSWNPAGADATTVPRIRSTSTGLFWSGAGAGTIQGTAIIYSGWRGANAYAQARFWGSDGGIIFRYQDESNFHIITCNATGAYVRRIYNGSLASVANFTNTNPEAQMPAGGGTITVDFRWWRLRVWLNDVIIFDIAWAAWGLLNGFVGLWSSSVVEVSNFILQEPLAVVTTSILIKSLLAYAEEHSVQLEEDETTLNAPVYDLSFGPQSNLDTPEKALRQLLTGSKLNIVWRQDDI